MLQLLHDLKNANLISELNYQFARFIDNKQQPYGYTRQQRNLAVLLSALVSYYSMQGNSCVRLDTLNIDELFRLNAPASDRHFSAEILQKIDGITPLAWQEALQNHIAFSDSPDRVAPLLFQHNRLYFYRYWQAENRLARYLIQAVGSESKNTNIELNRRILSTLFQPQPQTDWQQVAVATALKKRFCLISGGPGTGKTRTVAMLLAALQLKQSEQERPPLNIALAAPTGKAAARLKESISASLLSLDLPETLKQVVPTNASTIHRLIGMHAHSDTPRHHAKNPLHLDVLVVDEASMIDLFVMDKLLATLKPATRLILLGDKDQLASVEAGNMMGELGELITLGYRAEHCTYLTETTGYPIYPTAPNVPAICDSLCHLRHSYRFSDQSGIGRLAAEINARQAVGSWQIFANTDFHDLQRITYPSTAEFAEKRQWVQHCVNLVVQQAVEHYRHYLTLVKQREKSPQHVSVSAIFAAFQQVRFLSALRVSELGVEQLNQSIAEALQRARLIHFKQSRESYIGKPILITENAPQNHVFSGDIGLMLPDENGQLRVYFEQQQDNEHRHLSPSRVPSYEPAYVMTVHKSQGSEFQHTLMVMPLTTSPVLTKELLYTAVTRAKQKFTLFGDEQTWKHAVKTSIQRQSGLREQLLQAENILE